VTAQFSDAHADLDGVETILAMMIIGERETQPFTPVEQVAVDAIVSISSRHVDIPHARELMVRFVRARKS
jgi:hypothetical protein